MKTAVYPGSFDPLTNGHLDVITRASHIFDKVVVGVLTNSAKKYSFSAEERLDFIYRTTTDLPNVSAEAFSGMLVEFAEEKGANTILKGLRAISDFEYEFQMALVNKSQISTIETLFLPTSSEYMFLSSSVVKEVARYNGKLDGLVPKEIENDIFNKFKRV